MTYCNPGELTDEDGGSGMRIGGSRQGRGRWSR